MRNEDLQELLDSISVEDYLDHQGIEYRLGRGASGPQAQVKTCPICGDSRWRVYLGTETGFGNCFHGSCEAKYNKWTFIKAHTGLEDAKAIIEHIKQVARELGWRPKRTISVAVTEASDWQLPLSWELPTRDGRNLIYLEKRGITGEVAKYFHLRYCEDAWFNFSNADGSRGGRYFGKRVIIPVYDLDGTMVNFQGRDTTGAAEPKYLFPPGLPGTGRFLLNGQNVMRAKRVLVNEGFFDVAAAKLALDQEVALRDIVPVGTFGKHLSYGDAAGNDQLGRFLRLRREGLEEVILMWDGEAQAFEDAISAGDQLRKIGLRVRIARLPKDKDPNEVDGRVVREAVWKAEELTPAKAIMWRLRNPYR